MLRGRNSAALTSAMLFAVALSASAQNATTPPAASTAPPPASEPHPSRFECETTPPNWPLPAGCPPRTEKQEQEFRALRDRAIQQKPVASTSPAVTDYARGRVGDYPDAKALVLNHCPFVELTEFHFNNAYLAEPPRFWQHLQWKNIGTQPLVAFEIVILKYDAFDRRLIGTRWTVTGTDSADWRPLRPGESAKDGTSSVGTEEVFTAIAYVRAARLHDGTIWLADESLLKASLRQLAPGIKDFGDVKPDPRGTPK
jgi:hypothetical protein